MRFGTAIRPSSRSFMVAMSAFLGFLFVAQPATAQWVLAQNASSPQPQASGSSKPMLATLPPAAIQTAASSPPLPHAFWDRTNIALFSGIAVTRGLDYASTRNFQARGRQEILLPDDVVNNSAGFASLEGAATMTNVGMAYLLHRTGHHKLERWLSIGHISVTGFGVIRNYSLESRHNP
jgi:hypothetical protein